jgi:hypothetical protein
VSSRLTHAVATEVEGDLIQPRGELGLPPEVAEAPEGLEKRLLTEVTGLVVRAQYPVDGPLDLPLPAVNECVERGDIAPLEGRY